MMTAPKHQTTTIGSRLLPHCTHRLATVSEASTSMATMPRFDGFQMCRPSTRSTYFEVIEIAAQSGVGPELGRADQHADADARDVGAGQVRPLAAEQPPEHHLDHDRGGDREDRARPALEEAERELADDEDHRHEDGREVALVDAAMPMRWRQSRASVAGSASVVTRAP